MTSCKCDANTWTTGHAPICDRYVPGDAGFCQQCWHDEGCHYNEEAIRADERRKVLTPFIKSHRADPAARVIADRHYNRQKVGAPQFVPPGRCLVFRADAALWVTSWPFAEYVKHAWAGAWINSCFRREGGMRASELIRLAVSHTRFYWPDVPELGLVTFVDESKVRPTIRHGKEVFGYCYRQAGFEEVGRTKGGLLALQLLPSAMPAAAPPSGELCI